MHARQLIRNAIAAQLANLATTGPRVYASRVFSLDESDLPSISVFTGPEEITRTTLGRPSAYHRNLTVTIEGHAIADETVDASLDQIALEVEQAMANVLTVEGVTLSTQLQSSDFQLSGEGEAQIGLVRLIYLIPYSTLETNPNSLTP